MNKRLLCLLCLAMCSGYACSDDSSAPSTSGKCSENQVLAKNGICYDNPKCKKCLATEVCVGGKCYDEDSACGKCAPDEVCNKETCFSANDPCAYCFDNETCVSGECLVMKDVCSPECASDEYCDNGRCKPCVVSCGDECCSENQVCGAHGCEANPEQKCGKDSVQCGNECCESGEVCNKKTQKCDDAAACDESKVCADSCCDDDEICEEGVCRLNCEGADRCGVNQDYCCDVNEVCEDNKCKLRCDGGTRCGMLDELCCSGATPDCLNNVCVAACEGTRCGENSELCCDAGAQICIFNQCLSKGAECKSSYECDFDEFCDELTSTCVKSEANPNACVVKPLAGKFEPVLKWHWPNTVPGAPSVYPSYNQVMNIPIVINLTDDNGDHKIDENDTPDLFFSTYAEDWTGMNVIRAISGDDGHELATHPEIKFFIMNDPGAAKVNGDEYPEIVVHSKESGVDYTVILNLVPKTGASGYEFKEVAKLPGTGVFPRFANLDGGKFPQIVVSDGIIEYQEDGSGNGTYRYRCHADFGVGQTGYTVADLDGDTLPEIVGNHIYNNQCQVISTDTVEDGTTLADVDLVDDHANGRLDVEQIVKTWGGLGDVSVPNPPPGKIHVYKVFKSADGKFHRERMWEKEMPVSRTRVENVLVSQGQTYSDGTPFSCNRSFHSSYNYGGNWQEYTECMRRYTCSTGGGPLVIADFNADKRPDIGLATSWSYVVFDSATGNIIWADFNTQDSSSKETGSSVFDFEGNGVAEVLYADEIHLHAYTGTGSGVIDEAHGYCSAVHVIDVNSIAHTSGTLYEYPLVVDVDNDSHSEIVFTSNGSITGIRAYGDANNHWVRTRRIWNQYDYHVTNINEDGTVPQHEAQNWKNMHLNNFRQNVQPDGLYNAPNLVAVSLEEDAEQCTSSQIVLKAKIENRGSIGIKAGLRVKFYVVDPNGEKGAYTIGEMNVPQPLPAASSYTLEYKWNTKVTIGGVETTVERPATIYFVVDEPVEGKEFGEYLECHEDDNDNKSEGKTILGCVEIN